MNTILVGVDAPSIRRMRSRSRTESLKPPAPVWLWPAASTTTVANAGVTTMMTGPFSGTRAEFIARRMSRRLHDIDVSRVHARSYPTTAPDHGLSELAVSERVALIIVGTSRAGSLGDALPGGTGARLLHEGVCAVAVVPRGYLARAEQRLAGWRWLRRTRSPGPRRWRRSLRSMPWRGSSARGALPRASPSLSPAERARLLRLSTTISGTRQVTSSTPLDASLPISAQGIVLDAPGASSPSSVEASTSTFLSSARAGTAALRRPRVAE